MQLARSFDTSVDQTNAHNGAIGIDPRPAHAVECLASSMMDGRASESDRNPNRPAGHGHIFCFATLYLRK